MADPVPAGAATAAPRAAPGPPTEQEADPRRWIALFVVLTAAFMVLLDISIVNVAIPSIQRTLDASFGEVQLVLAGYQLAYAVVLITGGRLGDIFGRKRLFMIGMGGFITASALCGLAQSPTMLIASRVFQGLMAALMYPQVLSVIQVSFPPRERGSAFGVFGATIGIATIAGPLVGGLIIGNGVGGTAWRWIFLVNVPIGLASLVAATLLLRESRAPSAKRLDLIGVAIVSVGLGLLTYPLVEGRDAGWPAWTFIALALSLPVLVAFVVFERGRQDRSPLMELSLFRVLPFRVGVVLSGLFFSCIPSFFLTFSLVLQIGLGYGALHAGLTTMPFAVGSALASTASARLAPRLGSSILQAGSLSLVAGLVGLILTLHEAGPQVSSLQMAPSLFVCGVGLGLVIAPLLNVILAGINPRDAGSASGVVTTIQQVGGAIGVAIVGVIFFGLLGSRADTVSSGVNASLTQQLAAAGLPSQTAAAAASRFDVCFHDRANAKDPSVAPPSCAQLQASVANESPAVQAAFGAAAQTALAEDFEGSFERTLGYQIVVFLIVTALVPFLPRARRAPPASGEPAPAAH